MSGRRTGRGWICSCKGSMSAIYPRQHTMTKGKKGEKSSSGAGPRVEILAQRSSRRRGRRAAQEQVRGWKYWPNAAAEERDAAAPPLPWSRDRHGDEESKKLVRGLLLRDTFVPCTAA